MPSFRACAHQVHVWTPAQTWLQCPCLTSSVQKSTAPQKLKNGAVMLRQAVVPQVSTVFIVKHS